MAEWKSAPSYFDPDAGTWVYHKDTKMHPYWLVARLTHKERAEAQPAKVGSLSQQL